MTLSPLGSPLVSTEAHLSILLLLYSSSTFILVDKLIFIRSIAS